MSWALGKEGDFGLDQGDTRVQMSHTKVLSRGEKIKEEKKRGISRNKNQLDHKSTHISSLFFAFLPASFLTFYGQGQSLDLPESIFPPPPSSRGLIHHKF